MKKILESLSVMLDILKSFIIAVMIIVAIIVSLSSIIHNVFKIREIYAEDTNSYKQLVTVNQNRMNIQIKGGGDKTIVILSDYATPSPIIQYKTYMDKLLGEYRVIILEYFGYGFSLSSKEERTSANIANEIKIALGQYGVNGNFSILANGTSSLYAYTYTMLYPNDVNRLILVDGVYPETIKENFVQKLVKDKKTNAILNSYAELTGFARIVSYVNPSTFGIDKMREYGFSDQDIKFYRRMIANRFYTSTMRNEIKKLQENMENLQNYKLPEYLPVTQILSQEYVDEYQNYKDEKVIQKNIEEYANNIITNTEIQRVVVVDGKKNLNIYNPDAVVQEILSQ